MSKKRKSHYHADMLSVEEARENILSVFNTLEEAEKVRNKNCKKLEVVNLLFPLES